MGEGGNCERQHCGPGQGGKGEDNWTIRFRQHGHQGVTPWVASHAFLGIIIVIVISIILIMIVTPCVPEWAPSSCLPKKHIVTALLHPYWDCVGRYATQKSFHIFEGSLERHFGLSGVKNQMCLTKMYPGPCNGRRRASAGVSNIC